jgi:hypothetical protein
MKIPVAVSRPFAWLWTALLIAPVFAQQIVLADGLGATFAQPQSTVNLQVVVQDSQGNPLVVGPARDLPDDPPLTLAGQTALLWIDDDPRATYDHPVRWVMLDTSSIQPAVAALGHLWAPFITPADGSSGYSLIAPYFSVDPDTIPAATATALPPAKASPPFRLGNNSNTTTCVVLV